MRISFSPQFRDDNLVVSKQGDVLTINGEAFDFSGLPDRGTIPAGEVPCEWIVGPVERIGGEIHLTLVLPHGRNPSKAVAFAQPIEDVADGQISVPHDEEEPADVDG